MPRGIPNIPKLKPGEGAPGQTEPPAIGQDTVTQRHDEPTGKQVWDIEYDWNGVIHTERGFASEQAARDWLKEIRESAGAYEVAP